ncbi:metallophosphoesterase [uncultured Aquitalea sp.]|uniref:metallophosphoesterase family protein n=1 Tax=uncultured Aquitalea sp. TaxID=540272 RepID=UPI0025D3C9E5|nr:metallophosphoesterase [uncultured Aquitalea sp.]
MPHTASSLRRCCATALLSLLFSTGAFAAKPVDKEVFSFATVGDSREEPGAGLSRQDAIWLQNTRAWSRMLREIQATHPKALFFNGDMIMGYTTDKPTLNRQYAYWRGMVSHLMETGTYVLPVPGNHEVQEKFKDAQSGKTRKVARQSNEDSWRDNMGDLILDAERWPKIVGSHYAAFDPANHPQVGEADRISTDQTQLSYSFDVANSHFVVINTDPVGNDGHPPTAWLAEDLARAKERGSRRFFVFGHKPAYTYFYKPGIDLEGFDNDPPAQQAFWRLIEQYGATYFCGHEHIFSLMQPQKTQGGKAWQVMVGSGGSPFSAEKGDSKNPEDRTYAWAQVKVYQSGKVKLEIRGFDDSYGPTRSLRRLEL